MNELRAAHHAMATRFEFVLYGDDLIRLRALAEEAFAEIDRLEDLLSVYRPHSDIARVNARAGIGSARVMPETFRLLERARAITEWTRGAFDVTAGALVRVWGFTQGSGQTPDPGALAEARSAVGWANVSMNAGDFTVGLLRAPAMLDLGGIGKGYALERAAEFLREAGVACALLHGGTSTLVALGNHPSGQPWKVGLPDAPSEAGRPAALVALRDEALSVSAPWGKSFTDSEGRQRGHILDPRTGQPSTQAASSAVALPSATESDALSTAVGVAGRELVPILRQRVPQARVWIAGQLQ